MHAEKISEIKAHFIGLFDAETEAARLRLKMQDGRAHPEDRPALDQETAERGALHAPHTLGDFTPGVKYVTDPFSITGNIHGGGQLAAHHRIEHLPHGLYGPPHLHVPHHGFPAGFAEPKLPLHQGPEGTIAHITQVTVLYDDDRLDMTGGEGAARDLLPVFRILSEMTTAANAAAPFADLERTDTAEGLTALADRLHAFRLAAEAGAPADDAPPPAEGEEATPPPPPPAFDPDQCSDAPYQTSDVGDRIDGVIINGEHYAAAPELDPMLPERGIAAPVTEEPEGQDTPQTAEAPSGDSVTVAAGANVLVNSVGIVDAGMFATVCAVAGDYREIDAVSQVTYVSSGLCLTGETGAILPELDQRPTLALNIASFERDLHPRAQAAETQGEGETPTFPDSWRVSVVSGDLTFVNWIEQYQLVSDNDTMVITRSGTETSIVTGGNVSFDTAAFFGVGIHYDLVIVGGTLYDINVISQIAVLYDRDTVSLGGSDATASVAGGGNLLWNEASIHSYGAADRFEDSPQGITDAMNAIETRDPTLPDSLATDPHFAGYSGLNVLYITGNLFQANVIKQVAVLGDSDMVKQVANGLLDDSDSAAHITIETGNNALVNVASITDYDSFGTTTYVGGGVYSDAILVQAGLVDNDTGDNPLTGNNPSDLASEVVAFLDTGPDCGPGEDSGSPADFSWAEAHMPDVMQTVTG